MAKEAYRVPDGMAISDPKVMNYKNIVHADDLGYDDKKYWYRCCGRGDDGIPCSAEVTLHVGTTGNKGNHFQVRGLSCHVKGCNSEKRSNFISVSHLDITGTGVTGEALFDKFGAEEAQRHPSVAPNPDNGNATGNTARNEDQRSVKLQPKHPKSLRELFSLLASLNANNVYAGNYVNHQFINGTNVSETINNPLQTEYIMVLGQRTHPKFYEPNAIVLADAYFHVQRRDPLYFILYAKNEREKKIICNLIFGNMRNDDRYAIYASWRKELIDDIYVVLRSCPISGKHIYRYQVSDYPY